MYAYKRLIPAIVVAGVLLVGCGDGTDVTSTGTDLGSPGSEPAPSDLPTTTTAEPSEPSETTSPAEEPPAESGKDEPSPKPAEPAEPEPESESQTDLTIALDPGSGDIVKWTITCDPDGGSVPNASAACETLGAIGPDDVPPVPPDAMCTMQYGGPQTAVVTGSWNGTKVNLGFSRQNGCEIARWDAMSPVLPSGDATS